MFWSAEMTRKMSMEVIYKDNKDIIDTIGKKIKEAVKNRKTGIFILKEEVNLDVISYLKIWGYEVCIMDDGVTYNISWL